MFNVLNLLFLALLGPFTLNAKTIKDFSQEYIQNNAKIFESQKSVETAELNILTKKYTKTWTLSGTVSYTDSQLESSSTYSSYPTLFDSYGLTLQKSFEWGGTLSFNQSINRSKAKLAASEIAFASQEVSYGQSLGKDFFGKGFRKDLEVLENGRELSQVGFNEAKSQGLSELLGLALKGKLNKTLFELQGEVIKRAKKRLALVKMRVRDGLREKADLYQAESLLLSQIEQKNSFNETLAIISSQMGGLLNRKVEPSEFTPFDLAKFELMMVPEGSLEANYSLRSLEILKRMKMIEMQRAKLNMLPEVTLTTSYKTNDYDASKGDAFGHSILGQPNDEKTIALTVKWNIGNKLERVARTKAKISQDVATFNLLAKKRAIIEHENALKSQLYLINQRLQSNKKRVRLANNSLNEYSKLYRKGRADLDQVIRAEEEVINTERGLAQLISNSNEIFYQLHFLYGSLENFLLK